MLDQIVLMYHDVYKETPAESGFQNDSALPYKVKLTQFESQVAAISEVCYKMGRKIQDVVEFTFDDGGISFYTEIAPILEKYGLRGIFFISTKHIDTDGFMQKFMIKELSERGHIIGSHSHTHPGNISQLNYNDILEEWVQSAQILSQIIGSDINIASIPNGYYSREVLTACKNAGFEVIYTSKPSAKSVIINGIELKGRYVVHNTVDESFLVGLMSSKLNRMFLSMRYNILYILKRMLGNSYDKVKSRIVQNTISDKN